MEMAGIIPIGLSIALFFITLIIIFALRRSDQNSRKLANVKKLVDQIQAQTEKADSNFKQELAEIEVQIGAKEDNLRNLIQTCTTQINTLDSYYDDFSKLGSAMQTYRVALQGVQKLTDSTRESVESVQADVDRLEEVRQLIESFRMDMQEAENQLIEHEKAVITLERESLAKVEEAVNTAKQEANAVITSFRNDMAIFVDGHVEQIETSVNRLNTAMQSNITELREATDSLGDRSLDILQNMGNRTNDQLLLSEQLAELENRRVDLQEKLEVLDELIRQKEETLRTPAPEPAPEPEPEPEPELENQFEIQDMDFDLAEPEPEPAPEPEPEKKREKVEYTGEDEEIIFG